MTRTSSRRASLAVAGGSALLSRQVKFARNVAALALVLIFVAACATVAPTPENIQGRYELRGKGIYAGETVEIHGDTFSYSRFSDDLSDPNIQGMPVRGRYTLSGSTINFHHARVRDPQRTLERHRGRFSLWTPSQLAERKKTGKTPLDVLYQQTTVGPNGT